jgi:hypothetical protein
MTGRYALTHLGARGRRIKRRELMLLLAGAMTPARGLWAQQNAMPVIGYLNSTSPGTHAPLVAAFRQGLRETGYVEGQTWRSNTVGPNSSTISSRHWPLSSLPATSR